MYSTDTTNLSLQASSLLTLCLSGERAQTLPSLLPPLTHSLLLQTNPIIKYSITLPMRLPLGTGPSPPHRWTLPEECMCKQLGRNHQSPGQQTNLIHKLMEGLLLVAIQPHIRHPQCRGELVTLLPRQLQALSHHLHYPVSQCLHPLPHPLLVNTMATRWMPHWRM